MSDPQNVSDVQNLYQEVIIDHHRNPRNFHTLDQANRHADGLNPLCGDKLSVYVQVEKDVIKDIGFTGTGCAIFIAAASMMTECVKGKTLEEIKAISEALHQMLNNSRETEPEPVILGKLTAFSGVRGYPARIKCATLPWKTLQSAVGSP